MENAAARTDDAEGRTMTAGNRDEEVVERLTNCAVGHPTIIADGLAAVVEGPNRVALSG